MGTLPPAVVFFSINKVVLSYLNARSWMRLYALTQGLRACLIAGALLGLALARVSGPYTVAAFALAEGALALVSVGLLAVTRQLLPPTGGWRRAIRGHLRFGWRILPANLVLEFNTKIDIITMGLVTGNDKLVGHYSLAALLIEGFYQLFVVVRRTINPALARAWPDSPEHIIDLRRKLRRWLTPAALLAAAVVLGAYFVACQLWLDPEYAAATWPLAIMLAAVALTSPQVALGNLLAQTGHPSDESLVNVVAAGVNLAASVALIAMFGMMGAAVSVAASYGAFALMLRYRAKRRLGLVV
jgi:O-antigen/teichoic acid export membrane protein